MGKNIPTQFENPNGLHQRYLVKKLVKYEDMIIEKPADQNAEYFVMRLDEGGKDINHIKACRIVYTIGNII